MPLRCLLLAVIAATFASASAGLAAEPLAIVSPRPSGQSLSPGLPEYRVRPADQLEVVYRLVRDGFSGDYQFEIGDCLRIESLVDDKLNRELTVQPDGTIDLLLLGPVRIVRQTAPQVQSELNERYKKYYKLTDINVTRVKTHSRAAELLSALQNHTGAASKLIRVTPEGTISLPAIGVLPAQGLTLAEIEREATERYKQFATGLEVSVLLAQSAPQFVFIVGQVRNPGRHELTGPTSLLQSLALGGGWTPGQQPGDVIIVRRDESGQLLATRLSARGLLCGEHSALAHEFWIGDGDVIVAVPQVHARCTDAFLRHCLPSSIWHSPPQ